MTINYQIPAGVQPLHQAHNVLLSTAQGGQVLVDRRVLDIWQKAGEQDLDQLLNTLPDLEYSEPELRAALACLCQAGLLGRRIPPQTQATPPVTQGPLVSVVIVSYNSQAWLTACLASLSIQSYQPLEIILVDNQSSDGTGAWLAANYPAIPLIQLFESVSLAQAINTGVEAAQGTYFLVLNPDVRLEPDAVSQLVRIAQSDQNCAAVAAKLKLYWAPGFLNGLGNVVGFFSYGADIGLGHLDLGQFDNSHQLPSACFAAALLSRQAWQIIGPLDAAFPLYYEDSEWCYRTRICGFSVLAAPEAIVYHAFGSRPSNTREMEISPTRLERVVYGRLRFAGKLFNEPYRRRLITRYLLEDSLRLVLALLRRRGSQARAIRQGWMQFRKANDLEQARASLQTIRQIDDETIFKIQQNLPPPLIWRGLPILTWDIIQSVYLPLIQSGNTIQLPEFKDVEMSTDSPTPGNLQRWNRIRQLEGTSMLFHRLYRAIQWRLAQP